MTKKTKIIIAVIVIGVIVFVTVLMLINRNKNQTATPSPTPIVLIMPKISPEPGRVEMGNTLSGIELDFNTPVDPSSVVAVADPQITLIATKRKDFPNKIILSPQSPWKAGNYTIVVKSGIRSLDGTTSFDRELTLKYIVFNTAIEEPNKVERPDGF